MVAMRHDHLRGAHVDRDLYAGGASEMRARARIKVQREEEEEEKKEEAAEVEEQQVQQGEEGGGKGEKVEADSAGLDDRQEEEHRQQRHPAHGYPLSPHEELSLEDTLGYPSPGYVNPSGFAFSPDDALISNLYSAEGTLSRMLYAFDVSTGQQRLLAVPSRRVDEVGLILDAMNCF